MRNKKSIAILLGDPSGIGPELISKILSHNIVKKINIIIFARVMSAGKKVLKFVDCEIVSGSFRKMT